MLTDLQYLSLSLFNGSAARTSIYQTVCVAFQPPHHKKLCQTLMTGLLTDLTHKDVSDVDQWTEQYQV